jgi:hypothetical protein
MKLILPFVSVVDGEPDARFPVTIYMEGMCECEDRGGCSPDTMRLGDEDPNSPVFCAAHFHSLHAGDYKQSHIEPMTADEMTLFGI